MNELKNIAWLLSDKVFKLSLGLFVTLVIANSMGSELFGHYNYILSIWFLMIPFATLGMDNNLTKEFVRSKNKVVFTNAIVIKLLLSVIIFIIPFFIYLVNSDDVFLYVAAVNVSYIFKSSDVIRYYWESKLENKLNAIIESITFFVANALKLYVVLYIPDVFYLIVIVLLEAVIYAMLVFFTYKMNKLDLFDLGSFDFKYVSKLIKQSLPLMLSTLSVVIYMKSDQLMLAYLSDYQQVAIMSLAVKFSQSWYFIPTSIITVLFTGIAIKYNNGISMTRELTNIYSMLNLVSLFAILLMFIFVKYFSSFMVNSEYNGVQNVLLVHMFGGFFVCINTLRSRVFSLKENQKYVLYLTMLGAFLNVILNLIFIPKFSAIGAAYSTLISQACVCFIFPLFFKKIRRENTSIYASFINYKLFVDFNDYIRKFKRTV